MKKIPALLLAIFLLCGCGSAHEVPELTVPIEQTDDDLIMAAMEMLWPVVYSGDDARAGFAGLTENQKLFFALNYMDMEIANGGLCQFLVNDGGMLMPYISDYMETLGAVEHRALLDSFLSENNIDPEDTSAFAFSDIEQYLQIYSSYPFDSFDEAYYSLEPLSQYLAGFIREHPEEFPLSAEGER